MVLSYELVRSSPRHRVLDVPKTATTAMKRIEVAINPELLDLFDAWCKSNHYPTRNEVLRRTLREKVERAS